MYVEIFDEERINDYSVSNVYVCVFAELSAQTTKQNYGVFSNFTCGELTWCGHRTSVMMAGFDD